MANSIPETIKKVNHGLLENFRRELRAIGISNEDSKSFSELTKLINRLNNTTLDNLVRQSDRLDFSTDFQDEQDLFMQVYINLKRSGSMDYKRKLDRVINVSKPGPEETISFKEIREDTPEFKPPCFNSGNISPKVNLRIKKGEYSYFANTDINEGEEIIIEKAAFLCNSSKFDKYKSDCYYCSKIMTKIYTCFSCYRVLFCSEECAQTCIVKFHRYECIAIRSDFFKSEDIALLALRMLFTKIDSYASSSYICITEEELKTVNLPSVLKSASMSFLEIALKKTIFLCIYLMSYTNFFEIMQMMAIHKENTNPGNFLFVGGYLLKYMCLAARYSLLFPNEGVDNLPGSKEMHFSKPSITFSLTALRHNCLPNSIVVMNRNYSIVKAGQNIKKGDEITISLIGMGFNTTQYEVRNKLSKKLLTCDCCNCEMASTTQYKNVVYKCPDCQGRLMRGLSSWKCYDCSKGHNPDEFELARQKFSSNVLIGDEPIKDQKHANEMTDWFLSYLDFHHRASKMLFEVGVKLLTFYLKNNNELKAQSILIESINQLNTLMHKYSYDKLNIIISMMYVIFSHILETQNPSYLLEDMLQLTVKAFETVNTFLCMEEDYSQLLSLLQGFRNCFIRNGKKPKNKKKQNIVKAKH